MPLQKHCKYYIILNITFIIPNISDILHCIRSDLTRFRLDQTGAGHVRVDVVFSLLHLNCLIQTDQCVRMARVGHPTMWYVGCWNGVAGRKHTRRISPSYKQRD